MWKKFVKTEVIKKCEKELKNEIKELEKLWELKEYFKNMNLDDARTKFKLRTQMLDVKFNYKHMPQNEKSLWKCDSCQTSIESQSHIMWCPSYSELRIGKDIIISVVSKVHGPLKLGIEAPREISVYREEIYQLVINTNRDSIAKESINLKFSKKYDKKELERTKYAI